MWALVAFAFDYQTFKESQVPPQPKVVFDGLRLYYCIRLCNKKKHQSAFLILCFFCTHHCKKKLNYQIETSQNTAKKKVSNKLLSRKPQNQGKTTFSKCIRSAVLIILAFPVYNLRGCRLSFTFQTFYAYVSILAKHIALDCLQACIC